jgi:hypothetical protein
MRLAPHFGQSIDNKNGQLDRYAEAIAANLRRVVQRVPDGQTPEVVDGTMMTFTAERDKERLLVHVIVADDVRAMAANRVEFKPESIQLVVDALTSGAADPSNLLDNRCLFIDCIKDFSDCLDIPTANAVFEMLGPMASGNIEISPDIPEPDGQSHPLSRMRFNGATRESVSSHALFVLACIERSLPGAFGERLQPIIESSLSSTSPITRKCAFAAVREVRTIAESTWIPLLLGTRDPDVTAAALAFHAISNKKEAKLTRSQWRMIAYALRTAQQNPSVELRCAAATAVTALIPLAEVKRIREDLEEVRILFTSDIAHCVRAATAHRTDG